MTLYDMGAPGARAAGITAAAAAIRAGGLVGMPTETVYGLAADATNPAAVARLYETKGRPRFNPLIIHVGTLAEAERMALFGRQARDLATAFWPGPLTLVLPQRPGGAVSDLALAGLDTIAVRVPGHRVALDVLAAAGAPLAAPSANRSGHVSPTTAAHVLADLGAAVDVVLDAGAARVGVESTILSLTGREPVVLRPGALAREDIEAALGGPVSPAGESGAAAPAAPGMLASHYAPSVPLRLRANEVRPGESLLAFGADLPAGADRAVAVAHLSLGGDLREAAANLFGALRELDRAGAPIAAMAIPERGLGEAINDRLRRAAAPRPSDRR